MLAARLPDLAPAVLAVDRERGWSLSADAGPTLRQVRSAGDAWAVWEEVLVRYADAQLSFAGCARDVHGAWVPELPAGRLPALLRELVAELADRPVAEGGLSVEDHAGLLTLLPSYDAWCAELAASPVPDSVQHDDLHSGNVACPTRDRPG